MATVNFKCSLCGKLMAVSEDHLGKRVRCPHCQQAVEAPRSRPEPAAPEGDKLPEPTFFPPQAALSDSIFEDSDTHAGDDLFGGAPMPLVEMPPAPPPTNPMIELPGLPLDPCPPPAVSNDSTIADEPGLAPSGLGGEGTMTFLDHEPGALAGADVAVPPPPDTGTSGLSHRDGDAAPPPTPEPHSDLLSGMPAPLPPSKTRRPNMAVPTLLIFLVPYSIVVTIAAVMLYFQAQSKKDPLELLPDPKPDKEGAVRLKKDRVINDQPISKRLLVALGSKIEIGDLEVEPKSVMRVPNKGLALTVKLRNMSRDTVFNPVSQDFNAYIREVADRTKAPRPFTFLEIGKDKVYGGDWLILPRNQEPFDGRLMPGEEMSAVLVTDERDGERVKSIAQFEGQLVWRIQVRRGLVTYRGKDYSTTGVVGVVFAAKDVPLEEKQLPGSGL